MGTFVLLKLQEMTSIKCIVNFCTILEETANVINKAKLEGRRVIAVGSTSIRTLESFWENGSLMSGSKWTDIFIYPGKKIQVADALITNFHLPKSTLLMMISAFAGYELTRKAYEIAVQERYRFFQLWDAMYIS
jgi:S-adenosylmethionine:tRNA ribosyltransferase-isomerase